jgi:hypothetical protein
MTHHDARDLDLERRLRRIAADPPAVPDSIDAYAHEVVRQKRRLSFVPGSFGRRPSPILSIAGVAAALVVSAVIVGLLLPVVGPRPAATWTPRPDAGQGEWTGLEWQDITAQTGGMFDQTPWSVGLSTPDLVRWSGGFAMMGGDFHWWLSKDGLTWNRASGLPELSSVVSIGGKLLADIPPAGGGGVWLSSDGQTWTPISVPFDVKYLASQASAAGGVAVVVGAPDTNNPPPQISAIYFTSDAATWTPATLPADLGAARSVSLRPLLGGFLAIGLVSDPNGSVGYSSNGGPEVHYSYSAWTSHDGLTWSADPGALSLRGTQQGRLGASNGSIHSKDGGATWQPDEGLPTGQDVVGLASNGSQIVTSLGSGAAFFVSEGDGHWRQLQAGGAVGNLPADGVMAVLPTGVLWISAGRVYFGEALSGVKPEGTLGWPSTPSPGPTSAEPTSTPAMVAP